jgi:hypothetical protein
VFPFPVLFPVMVGVGVKLASSGLSALDKGSLINKLNKSLGNGGEPVRDLLNLEDIKGKTVITNEERMLLSQIRFIAREFDIDIINGFLLDYEEYGVSVDGLSRQQFVDVHTQQAIKELNFPNPNGMEQQAYNSGTATRRL